MVNLAPQGTQGRRRWPPRIRLLVLDRRWWTMLGRNWLLLRMRWWQVKKKGQRCAGREKSEAQKDLEAKKPPHEKGERGETLETREEREAPTEKFFNGGAEDEQMPRPASGGGGSVFQAIGETLMEIGHTTKDLLVGQYPNKVVEDKDRESKNREEEASYRGAGKGI